jgi:hypothetical protein
MWCGNVTDTSASFRLVGFYGFIFRVATDPNLVDTVYNEALPSSSPSPPSPPSNISITVTNLTSLTQYYYGVKELNEIGTFHTFAPQGAAWSFRIGLGCCALTGSTSQSFSELVYRYPDIFIHMGNLHYEDITQNNTSLFEQAYDTVLNSTTQQFLYHNVPLAYIWDDHDFGGPNSNTNSPSKVAARLAYQMYFPHYNLVNGTGDVPIYQAFTIGRVRILLTDSRSEADPSQNTLWSAAQMAWFLNELSNWRNYSMIIFVSSVPWIGNSTTFGTWLSAHDQRRQIANFISENGIDNLVIVAGNARMIAIDDGTYSDYSNVTGHRAGIPVFQAAPLDQMGSNAGGPYSQGCYTYDFFETQQYGIFDVIDNGTSTCFSWAGYRVGVPNPLVTYEACVPFVRSGSPGNATSCSVDAAPQWVFGLLAAVVAVAIALIFLAVFLPQRYQKLRWIAAVVFSGILVVLAIVTAADPSGLTPYFLAIIVGALDVAFLVYLIVIIFTTEYKKPPKKEGKEPKPKPKPKPKKTKESKAPKEGKNTTVQEEDTTNQKQPEASKQQDSSVQVTRSQVGTSRQVEESESSSDSQAPRSTVFQASNEEDIEESSSSPSADEKNEGDNNKQGHTRNPSEVIRGLKKYAEQDKGGVDIQSESS